MNQRLRTILFGGTAASLLLASGNGLAIDPRVVNSANAIPTPEVAAAAPVAEAEPAHRGFLSGIVGCSADGGKQTVGAVAGGVLGGFLGNRIAGRGSRTLGTLLGGVMGAAAGSWLGCRLQQNDQKKAERALEDAVATGETQTWKGEESGASGKVEAVSAPNLKDIKFANSVEPVSGYTKVGGGFVAATTANLRSAPTTSAKILGRLEPGQRVWVPAEVTGQPWALISESGVAQGYVAKSLLKQESSATASNCKLVKQTISVPGSADETETLQACKDASGQWVMTRV